MQQKKALSHTQCAMNTACVAKENHQLQHFIRSHVHSDLKLAIQTMCNHRDDCGQKLIEESCHIGGQAKLVDAMRLVRLQKDTMLAEFLAFFDESYSKQIVSNHSAGLSTFDYLYNENELSHTLIKDEMLEIRAAVDKISDSINRRQWELQSTLTKRFSVLAKHSYDVNSYPISAWIICESFAKVVNRLKTHLSRKLIIIKMFEHSVVPVLERMYQEIDNTLVEHNIAQIVDDTLIEVKPKDSQCGLPAHLNVVDSGPNSITTSELDYNVKRFVAMQQMLHTDVDQNFLLKDNAETAVPTYSVADVITCLSVLQEKVLMLDHPECIALNSHVKPNLYKLLNIMSDAGLHIELDRKCSDVIDIVSMMFDFMLDDAALPIRLRTVIIRLQIPIIKVAILDDEFFNSRLQSARQLLNELAYSANVLNLASQRNNSTENMVILKVEQIVDDILKSFTTDLGMFTDDLRNFQQFLRTALKGRKEKTKQFQIAKDVVIVEIKQRLTSQTVPHVVEKFIKLVWNEVLTKVGLATKCEGKTWRTVLQITDDLIWSTQPKLMEQERKLLTNMIPRLLTRLQEGLRLVDYNQSLMEQFFQHLEHVHLNSLRGAKVDEIDNVRISIRDKNSGYHYKSIAAGAGMAAVLTDINNHVKKLDANNAQPSTSAFILGIPDSELMLNPSYVTVNEMAIGTWVAFSDNNRTSIGKLEWKCDFTEEYRFVDRNYTIVQNANLQNLVKLFDQSKAKVIDDIPWFDRAVDAVYHELQVA